MREGGVKERGACTSCAIIGAMNTVTVITTPDINHDTIPPKMIPRQLRRQRRPRQHHSALLLLPSARGAKHAGGRRGLRDNFSAAVYLRELAQDVPGNCEFRSACVCWWGVAARTEGACGGR